MAGFEAVVESTLKGMGYELVDAQASNRGRLLRIFIDKVPGGVNLDDCAAVSRQLTRVLAVEGVDYDRLEISSPGLDRPLRKPEDFARFAGEQVEVRMRYADEAGRRKYVGRLKGAQDGAAIVEVEGRAVSLKLDEVERARLVPTV